MRTTHDVKKVVARASYLTLIARELCPTPADAASAIAMALGMVSAVGSDELITWDDPDYQRAMRALYEHGQQIVREGAETEVCP